MRMKVMSSELLVTGFEPEQKQEVSKMAKAIVIYESKWGNTKKVADTIIEGMAGVTTVQKEIKED